MAGAHARLSASAAERWINCPGSARETAKYPDTTSPQAAEGTFAHEIGAACLTSPDLRPSMWLGAGSVVDGHMVECDEEMVEGVEFYQTCMLAETMPGDEVWTEMPLREGLQKLHPDLGGTADRVRWRPSAANLLVADLKYGAGVLVTAEENKQAKMYALGVMLSLDVPAKTISVAICQPRIEHPEGRYRVWTFDAHEIASYANEVVAAAEAANKPDAPLKAGYWCRKTFCPAARDCPAIEAQRVAVMDADFPVAPVGGRAVDVVRLAQGLDQIGPLKAKIAAMESFAYQLAAQGVEIPGWKLVEKQARRKVVDEAGAIAWATERGIDPYEAPKLKSPAQLEKGTKKADKEALAEFVKAESSGSTLVPDGDSRAEIKRIDDNRDFAVAAPQIAAPTPAVNLFS